jgi:hypothetical protein
MAAGSLPDTPMVADVPQVGFDPELVALVPVPVNETVAGEFVALLDTVTLPVEVPTAVGAKTTLKVADWVGVKTVPEATPLTLNSPPGALTVEIVTFEFPVFVNDTVCVVLLPTVTLLKFRLVELAVKVKVAATPVPVKLMAVGELGALLTIDILPDAAPTTVGRKATVIVAFAPALRFKGSE